MCIFLSDGTRLCILFILIYIYIYIYILEAVLCVYVFMLSFFRLFNAYTSLDMLLLILDLSE